MEAKVDEIQENIFRITLSPPGSPVSFNNFLIKDEMPALIHTGHQKTFDIIFAQVAKILDPTTIRYLTFSHFEPDECGNLNQWLSAVPMAETCLTKICDSSVRDSAIRPARIVRDGDILNLGKRKLAVLETPHFPHAWEACMFYESNAKVLFSSDIGTQAGSKKPLDSNDLAEEILNVQTKLGYTAFGTAMADGLDKLKKFDISILVTMHGVPLNKKQTERLMELLAINNREACKEVVADKLVI